METSDADGVAKNTVLATFSSASSTVSFPSSITSESLKRSRIFFESTSDSFSFVFDVEENICIATNDEQLHDEVIDTTNQAFNIWKEFNIIPLLDNISASSSQPIIVSSFQKEHEALMFLAFCVGCPTEFGEHSSSLRLLACKLNILLSYIKLRKLIKSRLLKIQLARINTQQDFWNELYWIQQEVINWNVIFICSHCEPYNTLLEPKDAAFLYWRSKFINAAEDILSLYVKWKCDVTDDNVTKNAIPLLLWPQSNALNYLWHLACLGTSWSDNDFPQLNPFQYFPWAPKLLQDFITAKDGVTRRRCAGQWLGHCSEYFMSNRPCYFWFSRMLLGCSQSTLGSAQ